MKTQTVPEVEIGEEQQQETAHESEAEKRINKAHFAAGLEGYPQHFLMEPE